MRRTNVFVVILMRFMALAHPAMAHEFWLDAQDYTLDVGQELRVDIRVGQDFKGDKYIFTPKKFYDFSVTDLDGKVPIDGRIGDMPAVVMTILKERPQFGTAFGPR